MLRINLKLFRKSDSVLVLTPHPIFRILFGVICVALMTGIYLNPGEKIPVIGIILILISIISVFYEERWIFDRKAEIIEYRFGLIFFYKKEKIAFDEIDEFNYSESTTLRHDKPESGVSQISRSGFLNGRPVRYSVFSLITGNGKVRNIEVLKSRSGTGLMDKGKETAAFCGRDLTIS